MLNSDEGPRALNNLAVSAYHQGSVRREHELMLESRAAAERVGSENYVRFAEGNLCWTFYAIGDWGEALRRCDAFIAECEAGSAHGLEGIAQYARAQILLGRDDLDGAERASARTTELATDSVSARAICRAHLLAARVSLELGRLDEARAAVLAALAHAERRYAHDASTFVLLAQPLGLVERLGEFLGRAVSEPWVEIARLIVAGETAEAARRLDEAGDLSLAAQVRLRSEEDAELAKAVDFFRSVGATRYVTRAEAQLAAMA
jgi:tetratricopeptide (TPR) repeat protein